MTVRRIQKLKTYLQLFVSDWDPVRLCRLDVMMSTDCLFTIMVYKMSEKS